MKVHGKRTQHDSAVGRVTGRTLFVDDLPSEENELFVDNIEQAGQKESCKKVVGKQVPHDSAVGHVTGEALFVDDLPSAKNELIVDYIASPVAHGKIKSLNYEEMAKLDGIVEVFTHTDIPGHNLYGPVLKDERFLAEDIVEYVGQPIAIIAEYVSRELSYSLFFVLVVTALMKELHQNVLR
jgi:xanthine dehydrogenase molybdopterin-binding subunit B